MKCQFFQVSEKYICFWLFERNVNVFGLLCEKKEFSSFELSERKKMNLNERY